MSMFALECPCPVLMEQQNVYGLCNVAQSLKHNNCQNNNRPFIYGIRLHEKIGGVWIG